jgi:hypothetical protein
VKQKVLLFTINITRNRMQNPIIKDICKITLLSVCGATSIVARQRLVKLHFVAKNKHSKNRGLAGRVVFFAVRVVSKESKGVILPRTSCSYLHVISARADNLQGCRCVARFPVSRLTTCVLMPPINRFTTHKITLTKRLLPAAKHPLESSS